MKLAYYMTGVLVVLFNFYIMTLLFIDMKNTDVINSLKTGNLLAYDWFLMGLTAFSLFLQVGILAIFVSDIKRKSVHHADFIGR